MLDHFVFDGIRTAICKECRFTFTRDIRSHAEIEQQYILGYDDKRQMDGQTVNAVVNYQLLRRFVPDWSKKSILDVGSGYGLFLNETRKGGVQRAVGVELSDAEREFSTRQLNIETYRKLSELPKNERFDIITLFEVIEHTPQPGEVVDAACSHLKSGGSLIIGTDNFESEVVKVLGDRFPKWIPHQHISLFAPHSLRTLVNQVGGLQIVGARSFTPWELRARQIIYLTTKGRFGGQKFSLQTAESQEKGRRYNCFALRLALNGYWFKWTNRQDLNGAMMYLHARKA